MTLVHIDEHTTLVTDRVELLCNKMEIIQESSGIPHHTDLYRTLGDAQTFLQSQRRLLVAHNKMHSAIIRELMKLYPQGLPNDLREVVFAGIEI